MFMPFSAFLQTENQRDDPESNATLEQHPKEESKELLEGHSQKDAPPRLLLALDEHTQRPDKQAKP
jgi:hypothetical protein